MNDSTLNIKIRNIEPKDYKDVKTLLKLDTKYHMIIDNNFKSMVEDNIDYFNNELNETLKSSENGGVIVCEITNNKKSKVVGILSYYIEKDNSIYISDLYIQSLYRSHGLATKLLNNLVKKFPKRIIKLMCLKKNQLGYNFYIKYGFKVDELSKGKKYKISSYIMSLNNS